MKRMLQYPILLFGLSVIAFHNGAFGGRRFVVRDGNIQETRIFANEDEWEKQVALEYEVDPSG